MEAIRGSSNLAQPMHMISRRDVNQKWLSIWRGRWEALPAGDNMACVHGPRVKFIWTWISPWPYFSRAQLAERSLAHHRDRLRAVGTQEGGSFSKPQNENYDLVHPLWWCGHIHKHLFSLTLAERQHRVFGVPCVRISFPIWSYEINKKGVGLWVN